MDTPKLVSMGMKRKDMHGTSEPTKAMPEKDYDNEVCYPCLSVSGKQAEKLGAESLDDGECVRQTVVWRVKKTTIETDGKKRYELSLDLVQASDPESVEDCADDADEADDDTGDEDHENSPGLDYILSGKGSR